MRDRSNYCPNNMLFRSSESLSLFQYCHFRCQLVFTRKQIEEMVYRSAPALGLDFAHACFYYTQIFLKINSVINLFINIDTYLNILLLDQ